METLLAVLSLLLNDNNKNNRKLLPTEFGGMQ